LWGWWGWSCGNKDLNGKESDLTSTASSLAAATSESSVSRVFGTSEVDNISISGMHSICFESMKEAFHCVPLLS
jgi:hypothetical protein